MTDLAILRDAAKALREWAELNPDPLLPSIAFDGTDMNSPWTASVANAVAMMIENEIEFAEVWDRTDIDDLSPDIVAVALAFTNKGHSTLRGGPWTRHGHSIPGVTKAGPGRPPIARCGGPSRCAQCAQDSEGYR